MPPKQRPEDFLANIKPGLSATSERHLDRESMRLFIATIAGGILAGSRTGVGQESPATNQFIKEVNQKGAEFVASLIHRGHTMPDPVDLGRAINGLQKADHHIFSKVAFIDNPTAGVGVEETLILMHSHAVQVANLYDQLPDRERANREEAALEITNIMSEFVEANPAGLLLDSQARQQLEQIASAYDAAFPPEQ